MKANLKDAIHHSERDRQILMAEIERQSNQLDRSSPSKTGRILTRGIARQTFPVGCSDFAGSIGFRHFLGFYNRDVFIWGFESKNPLKYGHGYYYHNFSGLQISFVFRMPKCKNKKLENVNTLVISIQVIHSFIHSGHFYSAPSSPLLLRGAPDYSTDTV